MQTILGSNGIIGYYVAKTLPQYTKHIRLVSRNPRKVNDSDELFPANLLDATQTSEAVKGSEVVYLTAGLTYNIKIWQKEWPIIMKNVIDACRLHKAKLVFFDNVYPYGKVKGWMTEETPFNPCSKKGIVRAEIANMLLDEMKKGELDVIIARAADFYGPNTPMSFASMMIFENLAKGKAAQWLLNDKTKHSLTYTPDAGKAVAMLGNTPSAYNQTWHVPTHKDALNGKEFIELAATAYAVKPNYMVVRNWLLTILGWFMPVIKESKEMMYQMEDDYLFSSEKFEKAFGFEPTSYRMGIVETAKSYAK